jgi:hypothetical protein
MNKSSAQHTRYFMYGPYGMYVYPLSFAGGLCSSKMSVDGGGRSCWLFDWIQRPHRVANGLEEEVAEVICAPARMPYLGFWDRAAAVSLEIGIGLLQGYRSNGASKWPPFGTTTCELLPIPTNRDYSRSKAPLRHSQGQWLPIAWSPVLEAAL